MPVALGLQCGYFPPVSSHTSKSSPRVLPSQVPTNLVVRPGPSLERQSFLQLHITPAALSGVTLLLLLFTPLAKLLCTQQDWPQAGR